jgi:hypothetical protein
VDEWELEPVLALETVDSERYVNAVYVWLRLSRHLDGLAPEPADRLRLGYPATYGRQPARQ